jgi:putative hemolysin
MTKGAPMTRLLLLIAVALPLAFTAGCGGKQMLETTTITPTQRPDETPVIPPQFDTDASRNCLTLGGTLTITTGGGADSSMCALPGGATIEAERLLRETRG